VYNRQLVAERAQTINHSLSRLRRLADLTLEEFRGNRDNYAVGEHHLRRALQALLDVGRHIAVKSGWGNPSGYWEIFQLFDHNGALSSELAEKGSELAGYRNRLVHDYAVVDEEELWKTLQTAPDHIALLLRKLIDRVELERRE